MCTYHDIIIWLDSDQLFDDGNVSHDNETDNIA